MTSDKYLESRKKTCIFRFIIIIWRNTHSFSFLQPSAGYIICFYLSKNTLYFKKKQHQQTVEQGVNIGQYVVEIIGISS